MHSCMLNLFYIFIQCRGQAHNQQVQVGADTLGIYTISQTIILIRNELHEDITKPIHEYKHHCDWHRVQAAYT